MTVNKFLELASILSGLFKLFVAKQCSLKSSGGVPSTALPGCIFGRYLFGCFQTCGPFCEVHPHPMSMEFLAEWGYISARTQWPGKNVTIWHARKEPLNVYTSYRLSTVPLRDFVLFWSGNYGFCLIIIHI